jgi:hypothetical protein
LLRQEQTIHTFLLVVFSLCQPSLARAFTGGKSKIRLRISRRHQRFLQRSGIATRERRPATGRGSLTCCGLRSAPAKGDDEDRQPFLAPVYDQADGGESSGSGTVLDRGLDPEIRPASMTDFDAAVAALHGSGERSPKSCVPVDHV